MTKYNIAYFCRFVVFAKTKNLNRLVFSDKSVPKILKLPNTSSIIIKLEANEFPIVGTLFVNAIANICKTYMPKVLCPKKIKILRMFSVFNLYTNNINNEHPTQPIMKR